MNQCEQGGAKRRRESIVKENSRVAPPRFELVLPPLNEIELDLYKIVTGVTGCRSFLRKAFLLLLSFFLSLSFLGPGEKAF